MTSTRPYLLRALYEWITENACTPHIIVDARYDDVMVPSDSVVDGRIVLNISASAVKDLTIGNEAIAFSARFGGVSRDLLIPIGAVQAIYAKENGKGLVFADGGVDMESSDPTPDGPKRPHLRIVK